MWNILGRPKNQYGTLKPKTQTEIDIIYAENE